MSKIKDAIRSREFAVVATVFIVLVLTELGLRRSLSSLSLDYAHLKSIPTMVSEMAVDRDTKVLIMGNSLARAGIDEDQLAVGSQNIGESLSYYRFVPDGGAMNTWRFAWERFFSDEESHPSVVLLCGGASHFRDSRLDPLQLGSNYVGPRTIFRVMSQDLTSVEDRLRLVAAFFSHGYGNAFRVHRRLLDVITPRYRQSVQAINEQLKDVSPPKQDYEDVTLENLESFIEERGREDITVIVVNMPRFIPYEAPPKIEETVVGAGGQYVDFRNLAGLDEDGFVDPHGLDPYHLNEKGAKILTGALMQSLADTLVPSSDGLGGSEL